MTMQSTNTAPARNTISTGAKPAKISPAEKAIPKPVPNQPKVGSPKGSVKGFSGNGVLKAKV